MFSFITDFPKVTYGRGKYGFLGLSRIHISNLLFMKMKFRSVGVFIGKPSSGIFYRLSRTQLSRMTIMALSECSRRAVHCGAFRMIVAKRGHSVVFSQWWNTDVSLLKIFLFWLFFCNLSPDSFPIITPEVNLPRIIKTHPITHPDIAVRQWHVKSCRVRKIPCTVSSALCWKVNALHLTVLSFVIGEPKCPSIL